MTDVRLDFRVPQISGVPAPTPSGYWLFRPSRLLTAEAGEGATYALLPDPFKVELVDGAATVPFEPTGVDWCWVGDPLGMVGVDDLRYFDMPASDVELDFYGPEIHDVDPASLDPVAPPSPSWLLALEAEEAAREAGDSALQDQIDQIGPGAVASVNGETGDVILDTDDLDDSSADHKFVTAGEKTKLANTTGTNTGDQDLSGRVPVTRTVAGHALSADVTLAQADIVGLVAALLAKADASGLTAEIAARLAGDNAIAVALLSKADLTGPGGTVLVSQLPSYVDDVLEFANLAAFPAVGESGKIYVDLDTNLTYRWTGSIYGVLDPSLALGETALTAYRGDRGKIAYDHSQITIGNPHGTTAADVGAQPVDADLTSIAAVGSAADKMLYATGPNTWTLATITAFARSFLDDPDAATARATLGLGTAALQAATAFDAAGAAAAAQAAAIASSAQKTANLSDLANAGTARTNLGLGTVAVLTSDTDGALAANSDTRVATQKATKTYVDQIIAAQDAMVFKGVIDASSNPNYPAADRGHTYRISVAGKIGGAAGVAVEVGDMVLCLTDGTAAGTQAAVGANWSVIQTNLDGAVIGPAVAVSADFVTFSGVSGKLIQDSGVSLDVDGTLAANSDTRIPSQKAVKAYTDAADIALISRSLRTPVTFVSGRYYGPADGPRGTTGVTTNTSTAILFVVPTAITCDRIGIEVTTAIAASTLRLGIYNVDPTTLKPTTLILDAGTVLSDTTGVKEITISQALAPGVYALDVACQGSGVIVAARSGFDTRLGQGTINTTANLSVGSWQGTQGAGALVSPFVPGANPLVGHPAIFVRAA